MTQSQVPTTSHNPGRLLLQAQAPQHVKIPVTAAANSRQTAATLQQRLAKSFDIELVARIVTQEQIEERLHVSPRWVVDIDLDRADALAAIDRRGPKR